MKQLDQYICTCLSRARAMSDKVEQYFNQALGAVNLYCRLNPNNDAAEAAKKWDEYYAKIWEAL